MIALDHSAWMPLAGGVVVLAVLVQRLLFGDATKRPRP